MGEVDPVLTSPAHEPEFVVAVLESIHPFLAFSLIEDFIHKGSSTAFFPASGADIGEEVGIQMVHFFSDVGCAVDPVQKDGLGKIVEEGIDIDWWSCAGFHDFGPDFHERIQTFHVAGVGCGCSDTPDETHGDGVGEAFGMEHVVFRFEQVVTHHLSRLGFLEVDMAVVARLLHECAVEQLPCVSPLIAVVHQENVVSAADEIGDVGFGALRVFGTFLVDELLDELSMCDDYSGACSQLEGVDAAVLASPFGELEVSAFEGDLRKIAQDWIGGWTWREMFLSSANEKSDVRQACT